MSKPPNLSKILPRVKLNVDGSFESIDEAIKLLDYMVSHDTASYRPYAYNDFSVDFSLPYAFTAPAFAQAQRTWTVAPFIGYSYTPYRKPDPIVDPTVTRLDRQWRVGTTLDMSFYQNLGFALCGQFLRHGR